MTDIPGHTATLAAVGRALHLSTVHERLIEDRLALDLAGEPGVALMAQLTATTPTEALEGLGVAFAIRARLVEDMVARSLGAGVAQYVILGAGLDTFALRRRGLVEKLRVFEVDRAPAQEWKRTRLAELRIPVPHGLTFVPADFEADALEEGLLRAGFTSRSPALVSWIAVTQYLSLEAIERTLRWAAGLPGGSRLVLTYVVPPEELPELARAGLAWTRLQAAARGEPFLSLFSPIEMAAALRRAGFDTVEHVSDAELRRVYLAAWPDAPLTGIERMVIATV